MTITLTGATGIASPAITTLDTALSVANGGAYSKLLKLSAGALSTNFVAASAEL